MNTPRYPQFGENTLDETPPLPASSSTGWPLWTGPWNSYEIWYATEILLSTLKIVRRNSTEWMDSRKVMTIF